MIWEYDDEDDQWTVVSVLIDDKGARRLTTLARFPGRTEAGGGLFAVLADENLGGAVDSVSEIMCAGEHWLRDL